MGIFDSISDFLSNRSKCVVINNIVSPPVPVMLGVPRGSVLGALLFPLYIKDIHTNIQSVFQLFADDCVIYGTIASPSDNAIRQADLDKNNEVV